MMKGAALVPPTQATNPGAHMHRLRTMRGMSLRDLALLAGTSAAFLSQVERGKSGVSVATLSRIAEALSVTMSELFDACPQPLHKVRRATALPVLPAAGGYRKSLLTAGPFRAFEAYLGTLDPGGATAEAPHTHGAAHELMFVLSGEVDLELGEERHRLGPGDSIEYLSSTPHRISNNTDRPANVQWIIAPLRKDRAEGGPA
jgi:transcriptional regulator with XRE-family HTH domain